MTITTDEHRAAATMCGAIVTMTRGIPAELLDEIIAHGHRYDAIAPIFDPTGWMQQGRANEHDTRIFAAVRNFRRELDRIAGDIEASR